MKEYEIFAQFLNGCTGAVRIPGYTEDDIKLLKGS